MKCLTRRPCVLLLLAFLLAPLLSAQSSTRPITEKGLEASLRTGGLKDAELVGIIQKRGVDFLLDVETEHALTNAGASGTILDAIRTNYRGPDSRMVTTPATTPANLHPAAPPPAPARTTLPSAPGIYVQHGGVWAPLQRESAEYVPAGLSKAFGKASGGLVKLKGDVNGEIAGTHSATTVTSPATLLIHMHPGASASDYLLVHAHNVHDNREFKISAENFRSKDSISYRLLDLTGANLQIEISQGAGDYAFVEASSQPSRTEDDHKTFLYTFQITP